MIAERLVVASLGANRLGLLLSHRCHDSAVHLLPSGYMRPSQVNITRRWSISDSVGPASELISCALVAEGALLTRFSDTPPCPHRLPIISLLSTHSELLSALHLRGSECAHELCASVSQCTRTDQPRTMLESNGYSHALCVTVNGLVKC